MYALLRLRARETVIDVIELLEDMALVEIAGNRNPSMLAEHLYVSTASTPSMRARDIDMADSRPGTPDGGNVKVVVRVRKFLQRGELPFNGSGLSRY